VDSGFLIVPQDSGEGRIAPAIAFPSLGGIRFMRPVFFAFLAVVLLAGAVPAKELRGHLETEDLPPYLRDRGTGMPLSFFGTYIQKDMFVVYPFFEYYLDKNDEYKPEDFNFTGPGSDEDFRGEYSAYEALIALAYGLGDHVALEIEAAYIDATLKKSAHDTSNMPAEISDSGIGDVEGQIRWRYNKESADRPEFFNYLETVGKTADEGSLIGTAGWEFKLGGGVIRGFGFGTMTARVSVQYATEDETFDLGEYALEYLRRLSPQWRVYGAFEGNQDELELLTEVQYHFHEKVFMKANSGFGLTSKATDVAPEVGVLFSF
jgi:hypothetical protein